jgi:hypothetical protein
MSSSDSGTRAGQTVSAQKAMSRAFCAPDPRESRSNVVGKSGLPKVPPECRVASGQAGAHAAGAPITWLTQPSRPV